MAAYKRPSLADGSQGVTHMVPPGDIVLCDGEEDMGLTVHDIQGRLQWSFKFFENLHMDLSLAQQEHRNEAIERLGRSLFEEHFHVSQGENNPSFHEPKTRQDPAWSPIVEIKYVQIKTESGKEPSTTDALIVIHRLSYQEKEEIVMARFLLPVRRGLYEVIAIAGDGGSDWGVPPPSTSPEETATIHSDPVFTSPSPPSTYLSSVTSATNNINNNTNNVKTTIENNSLSGISSTKSKSPHRTLDMDGHEYDDQFPNHCLSRVRRAMHWLTHKSDMVVTELPLPTPPVGAERELSHLRCRMVPPPRFLYCPNPYNPESNKYRFCRATLGGTDGVEMMVISAWYTERDIGKGVKPLRKVALHASRVIHASQQMFHIRITVEEISLPMVTTTSASKTVKNCRRWMLPSIGKPFNNQEAVITIVDCTDAQGRRKQNTIGFVREASTGQVYLMYFADTISMDHATVVKEISETLATIRVPRKMSSGVRRKFAWHAAPIPLESS
ncbi:hypothetical protein IV203_009777 [Nitzschia inconspicua]|uniref:Uncharacterized protein n=1 Tax=Nitzschia inconspicua TaxID=303405 RepID=A0A9K3KVA2_9STRA|nr:hypothetical protein IV203_009777 [Nitzschia inconspicua]